MGKRQLKYQAPKSEPIEHGLEPLYVGDWVDKLSVQHKVVKATGISQGYIANMSGGVKKNPSAAYLRRIAKFLKISVDDFYLEPPAKITDLKGVSPGARAALMRRIEDGDE